MSESAFDLGQSAVPEGSQTPTPEAGSSEQTGGLTSEQLLELKWNGRTQKVPLSRATELAQMGFDYTQKMQDLAKQREQVQNWMQEKQQMEAAIGEIRQFLTDRQRLRQYIAQLEAADGGGGDDASAVLTAEQVQRMLAQQAQQLQGMTQQQMQAMQARMQIDQMAAGYSQDFDNHIRGLKEQMPSLRGIPKIDKLIKEDVAQMRPRNAEEAKTFMNEVARNYAEQARQYFLNERKQEGMPPAPGLTRGIEPPGGSGPMPQSSPAFKGKLSDPAFKALVMQDMEKILAQNR